MAEHLLFSVNSFNASPDLEESQRKALLGACESLRNKLESPFETLLRHLFASHPSIALRIAVDMKLFDVAEELSGKADSFSLDELVAGMDCHPDPLLVARIMRFLSGIGVFQELGPKTYAATASSKGFVTSSPMAQGIIHMSHQNEIVAGLPTYFEQTGYQNPGDAFNGPFQKIEETKLHAFDWLATQPRQQHAFNVIMGMSRIRGTVPWYEAIPLDKKLPTASPSETLLVDVGGGVGHDLIGIRKSYPSLVGKMVVQDIPSAIEQIDHSALPTGISSQTHDFFSPQPIRGAKAYFLGNVLHDWPDKQALEILKHTREAMDTESVLLVCENTLPEMGASLYAASTDLVMMAIFAGMERTVQQFRTLFDDAGLKMVVASEVEGWDGGRRLMEAVVKT